MSLCITIDRSQDTIFPQLLFITNAVQEYIKAKFILSGISLRGYAKTEAVFHVCLLSYVISFVCQKF